MTQYASKVTIVHQFDKFQAYEHAIQEATENDKINFMMESEVVEFVGDEALQSVKVKNKLTGDIVELKVSGAFVFIGYVPNTDFIKDDITLSENKEIITDESMNTNLPGVFASGDVRQKKVRQITTSVADGTIAALSAIEYIKNKF